MHDIVALNAVINFLSTIALNAPYVPENQIQEAAPSLVYFCLHPATLPAVERKGDNTCTTDR